MLKWLLKLQAVVSLAFCFLLVFQIQQARSEADVAFEITEFNSNLSGEDLTVSINGKAPPVHTVSERFSPFRFVVDIAGGRFADGAARANAVLPANSFVKLTVSDIKDSTPNVLRLEFTLADSHDYTVASDNNSLRIKIFPAPAGNGAAQAAKNAPASFLSLKDIKISQEQGATAIVILANTPIEHYKVDTLPGENGKKPRMYIDIDDVKSNELRKEHAVGTAVDKIRVSKKDQGVRLVFDSSSEVLFKYTVTPDAQGLKVVIEDLAGAAKNGQKKSPTGSAAANSDDTLDALIGSSQQLVKSAPEKAASKNPTDKAAALTSDFSLSGYNKQRISVDFYKIDIHNVFRLFRQITNLNIIVDEEVQGSLTLALNDVPWDFALDIILNLMDLKKEERFNTIVIYPSKKEFVWPTRAEDNLSFEADIEVIEQESLVIEKTAALSKEAVEAKKFISEGQNFEERNELEKAAEAYAKSLELWPQNSSVAARLASIFLADLKINAKAAYYAKQCLKHDPKNSHAALYAAIALANMDQLVEAKEFFAQSINGTPPLKEALFSYAVFSETNGQYEAAITVLKKYESHYGENIDTMVSKARIYDKMGRAGDATKQYRALLGSGFALTPDLKKYIEGRIAAKDLK